MKNVIKIASFSICIFVVSTTVSFAQIGNISRPSSPSNGSQTPKSPVPVNVKFTFPSPSVIDSIIVTVQSLPVDAEGNEYSCDLLSKSERDGRSMFVIKNRTEIISIMNSLSKSETIKLDEVSPLSRNIAPAPGTNVELYWNYKDSNRRGGVHEIVRFSFNYPSVAKFADYPNQAYVKLPHTSPFYGRWGKDAWNGRIPVKIEKKEFRTIWDAIGLPSPTAFALSGKNIVQTPGMNDIEKAQPY